MLHEGGNPRIRWEQWKNWQSNLCSSARLLLEREADEGLLKGLTCDATDNRVSCIKYPRIRIISFQFHSVYRDTDNLEIRFSHTRDLCMKTLWLS